MTPGDKAIVKYDTELYSLTEEVVGKIKAGTEVFVSMGPQEGRFNIESAAGMGWIDIDALEPIEE